MDCKNTNKSIWSLVSGSVLQTNPGVLETELKSWKPVLAAGLATYKPNTEESVKVFNAKKTVPESWKSFVCKVGRTLSLEESLCWDLICSYLSTEFRGTQDSLKLLVQDEQKRRPLILDIWQFYRAERLYLLQTVKHILSAGSQENVLDVLGSVFENNEQTLKSIVAQLSSVIKEISPVTEELGTSLGGTCRHAWLHFHLREIMELLQILLIALHTREFQFSDVQTITQLFLEFGFGTKLQFRNELDDKHSELVRSVGYLSVSILVYMIQLPSSNHVSDHNIWSKPENVSTVERLISGIGNHPSHSPALLAWALTSYIARGAKVLSKSSRMGEVAIQNRVLKTLELILVADFMNHPLVADIIHRQVYRLVSDLLTVFDPTSLGLQTEIDTLAVLLLKHRSVAGDFWKLDEDAGLSLYFQETLANFPRDFQPLVECMTSLSSASPSSSQRTVSTLSNLEVYTERVDNITSRIGRTRDGCLELLEDRYPYSFTRTVFIPANTKGELTDNGNVRWRVNINGWQILLAECGELSVQLSAGEEQVRAESLKRVTKLSGLVSAILTSTPSMLSKLEDLTCVLGRLCIGFCQVSHPPLLLLAGITRTFSAILRIDTHASQAIELLKSSGLLPHFSLSHSLLEKSSSSLVPGVVGFLLAGEETVRGEYPLLLAFLNLLKEESNESDIEAGILFLCREVLPSFSNWRYQIPGQREQILVLCLTILLQYINTNPAGANVISRENGVCGSLLLLASTGDRTIQALLENQECWESGRGTDFCTIVSTSLFILDRLLKSCPENMLSGPVGGALRAPPSGPQPHLLLTLAHYSYFFHDPSVATAGISLLRYIAGAVARANSNISMLACLGSSAVSVRDLLLTRLESPLEDIRLKISIIDLLSECVNSQPGMVQLLLDINIHLSVVEGLASSTDSSKIVGEGCLSPVLELLAQCKDKTRENWQKLHLSILRLIYNLWDSGSLLATRFLKDAPGFWVNLCWPIYTSGLNSDQRLNKVKGFVLRILAHEIYTWKGKVTSELSKVLEKICHEKTGCLETWCQGEDQQSKTKAEKSLVEFEAEDDEMFLISSWKIFLLVLSKDCPVSISPACCRLTYLATVQELVRVLQLDPIPANLSVLLAETGAVLMKRWNTKCTDNMEALCKLISGLLDVLCSAWSSLHPRARQSILALALSTLRASQFKLETDQEAGILESWMNPVLRILRLVFSDVEECLVARDITAEKLETPELVLALLQSLITRFDEDKIWLSELHSEATLQLLLSAAGGCCRHKAAPSFVRRILELLVEISVSKGGAAALLIHNLAQEIWLPLSDVAGLVEWTGVGLVGLELTGTLLRTARTQALQTAITATALLSDKLVADLMKPRSDLNGLAGAASAARFVALLSKYISTWRSEHSASLQLIIRCCCSLLHYSTALLMRPTLLASILKVSSGVGNEEDTLRCRRVSSASCSEVEVELVPPQAASAHAHLTDISLSCLTLLISLSPDLSGLLTGDAMLDPDRWEIFLSLSFSSPTLEEEQTGLMSYGTLIALANTCVRSLTRDRSPSPTRSSTGRSKPSMDTPEKKGLSMVLERSLVLLLSQYILTLSHSQLSPREKQLLRRELGAELGSITDTWRRFQTRGGKSPGLHRGTRSPAPPSSPQPPGKQQEDQFMRFLANLVGNLFK